MYEKFATVIGESKDEAIQRAYDNADSDWRVTALAMLRELLLDHPVVTADDLYEKMPPEFETHSLNAVAGVFKTAMAKKWCEPSICPHCEQRIHKSSERKGRHSGQITIWKSIIFPSYK